MSDVTNQLITSISLQSKTNVACLGVRQIQKNIASSGFTKNVDTQVSVKCHSDYLLALQYCLMLVLQDETTKLVSASTFISIYNILGIGALQPVFLVPFEIAFNRQCVSVLVTRNVLKPTGGHIYSIIKHLTSINECWIGWIIQVRIYIQYIYIYAPGPHCSGFGTAL
jgi:hypothetical protein